MLMCALWPQLDARLPKNLWKGSLAISGIYDLRPLLEVPRESIVAYAHEHRLEWIEDESNASDLFSRNFIRLHIAPLLARAAFYAMSDDPRSWRDADWSSTGILPAAADSAPARVIIFTGTAGAWKGIFSVHSWVVLKHANEPHWQRYDVVGWGQPIRINNWPVDGKWYGNKPVMLADISGPEAEKLIPRIEATVKDYNYSQTGDYRIWPGPNSNSFIAAILRTVPELGLALPPNAVGRDFRYGFYAGRTDSGTGFEINLHGLAGLKLGWVEGVEVNLLGLVAGLDWRHPGLKLPGFGRIGIDLPVTTALAR